MNTEMGTASCPPQKQSQVGEKLNRLDTNLTELFKAVEGLESRLEGLLRPEIQPTNKNPNNEGQTLTPFASRINGQGDRVSEASARIVSMTERCEL